MYQFEFDTRLNLILLKDTGKLVKHLSFYQLSEDVQDQVNTLLQSAVRHAIRECKLIPSGTFGIISCETSEDRIHFKLILSKDNRSYPRVIVNYVNHYLFTHYDLQFEKTYIEISLTPIN